MSKPTIRFKGYTDDWEQSKAKEVFKALVEKGKEELPVLSVTQDNGVVYREDVGIDIKYDKKTLNSYKVIYPGNFVISLRSFQGGFELSDKLGITSPAYTIFEPKDIDNHANLFWRTKFKTFDFIQSLKTVTFGIRDGKSISFSEFGDLKLLFPSFEEQQKIGQFFKQLDDIIALHQRKLELLKDQKKGFLQKMFPKNGQRVPEIRFAGFTGDWEQRKLGEVFNQTIEYINPSEANLELWSVTVEKGLTPKTARYNREALVKKNDKFKVVYDGDIVYNPMNLTIGAVGFNQSGNSVAVSGYYVTMNMNSNFSNSYFQTWLKSANAIKQYKLYATGSLIEKQRVQFPTLSMIKSYVPSFEEQEKIGAFFNQLDDTIALHQRKLDKLKQTKQAFLQKMFV